MAVGREAGHATAKQRAQYFPFISLTPLPDLYDSSTEMAAAAVVNYSFCPGLVWPGPVFALCQGRELAKCGGNAVECRAHAQLCEAQPFRKRRGERSGHESATFSS